VRLPELQAGFGRALLGAGDAAALGVLGDGLEADARLRIYRHHVLTSLTDALRATYPVVCRLVDERFFAYAADAYIRACPPSGPCLFEYGGSFPEFLAAFPPCRELAYLPDVARLEWAMNLGLHAHDAESIDPARLGAVRPERLAQLVVHLHPSVCLLASPWPIDRIWRGNQPGANPHLTIDLDTGGAQLEVRRDGDDVVFRALSPAVYALRRALADGRDLGTAAQAALAVDPAFDLAAALRDLLGEGLIVDLTPPGPDKETH
jgi:hypothetical protein